jgi:hypothetical protein
MILIYFCSTPTLALSSLMKSLLNISWFDRHISVSQPPLDHIMLLSLVMVRLVAKVHSQLAAETQHLIAMKGLVEPVVEFDFFTVEEDSELILLAHATVIFCKDPVKDEHQNPKISFRSTYQIPGTSNLEVLPRVCG